MSARTAVVTGGGRGIGAATVARLLKDGHRVAALSRGGQAPEGAMALRCDVTSGAEVETALVAVVAELGPIEILVSNAGTTRDGLLLRQTEADFDDQVDVHLKAAWRLSKAVVPAMMRARHGRLIYVSSVVASTGSGGQTAYAAAKSGLLGLARSLAREVGSRNITANVVAPGLIDTELTAQLPAARRDSIEAAIALGRPGTPEEAAAAIAFLAGDDAGYVTGALLPVDGGLGMGA